MKKLSYMIMGVLILAVAGCLTFGTGSKDYTRYVNPFIGGAANGHTFPGACYPMGLVQPGPDTGNETWTYCSGYMFLDESIWGFSQTHLNGTGCPDLGDIQLQPFSGPVERENYHSKYSKDSQTSTPKSSRVTA